MAEIWYDENSHRATLSELKGLDDQYVNDAVVSCRMVDMNGDDVPGIVWPVGMVEDGSSTGTYYADLPASLEVVPNDLIKLTIVATSAGRTGQWDCKVNVRSRGC